MNPLRAKLTLAIVACAIASTLGCMAPWSMPNAKSESSARAAASKGMPPAVASSSSKESTAEPASTDMAGVMDKLEQVREMDPAAEQKLLDELRRTPPSSWPLVAEQFRASLAYHQQLAATPAKTNSAGDPMAEFRRALPTGVSADSPSAALAALMASTKRPSTSIGALADPRRSNADDNPMFAQSAPPLPAALDVRRLPSPVSQTAPNEFAASGPMYPIPTAGNPAVEAAAFKTPPTDPVGVASQALAKSEADRAREPGSAAKQRGVPGVTTDEAWQQQVTQAADELSKHVSPSPTTTAEVHQHVSLRLLRLLAGDTEKALEPIPHIPPAEQDYWSRQIFALATYLDHHSQPDDKRRAAASVAHLDEAVSHLRELGALSVRNLSFCKNVYGYGAFEPYEADIFSPGQQVSLYVEVENYHSTSSEKGYCTLLGATYEIVDDKGKRVSGGEFPDVDDCCRSRRRDFHIQFGLAMPASLSPGRYRVELVVKDRQSDKLGHATAPFEIRSSRK